MLISFHLLWINISTSLTVPGQPSPRFHVEAWLPFRNCEMDSLHKYHFESFNVPLMYLTTTSDRKCTENCVKHKLH